MIVATHILGGLEAGPFWVPEVVYREHGLLEVLSVLLWGGSSVVSLWAAARAKCLADRMATIWTAFIALLAGLRELDAHVWLNPEYLGAMGVRFRLDWWTDKSVAASLKAFWAAVFLVVFVTGLYPLIILRHGLITLIKQRDTVVVLFLISFGALALGLGFDDLLRKSEFMPASSRQFLEETVETLGALLFLAAVVLQWRNPHEQRVQRLGRQDPTRLS